MKIINIKYIEIFTDGTANLSYAGFSSLKQKVFHEKDAVNSFLIRKSAKPQLFQNSRQKSYKSKYKF